MRVDGHRLALLKPDTYMNDSGRSVQPAAAFYKVPLDTLLVVHDEVDLDFGRLQARLGGGLAGHNGLRSIAGRLGSPEFLRLRVGVGRPGRGDPRDVADFVLAPFEPEEDGEALSRGPRTRSSRSLESVSTRRSAASTDGERPPGTPSRPAAGRVGRRSRGAATPWTTVEPGTEPAQPVTAGPVPCL